MLNNNPETLATFTKLLNLPDIKVTKLIESVNRNEITFVVESTREILVCRECKKPTRGHGLDRTLRLRHLPMLGKVTYIEITPRRGRCEYCDSNPTTTERMDWYERNHKMTKPYEQHLLFELINSTVADVSRKEEVDYHAIDNLIERYIESEIDFSSIQALGILGLDEISLKKGYRDFITLITYRVNDKVHILGVVEGREKAEIESFLYKIPKKLRNTVDAICCDLYEGYMNACKTVFKKKIPIVADRFHVRKLYRKSVVNLRKSELKRSTQRREEPANLSVTELDAITRRFVEGIKDLIGPTIDIPAPDVNTNPQVMGWIMDEYPKFYGFSPAVVTGKPLDLFGSEGRDEATGRGVMICLEKALADENKNLEGVRVALQGFGNVGSHAARLIAERGGKIVAVADHRGGIEKQDGLDIPKLLTYTKQNKTVVNFPDGNAFDTSEIITWDADVLIPAALEDVITKDNANDIRAQMIVEAANRPTTPEAHEILERRNLTVIPDILANAGGVIVSYFEWVQNIQQFRWDHDRVVQELEKVIFKAYDAVQNIAKERKCDLRTAAFILAVQRVARAALSRKTLHNPPKIG